MAYISYGIIFDKLMQCPTTSIYGPSIVILEYSCAIREEKKSTGWKDLVIQFIQGSSLLWLLNLELTNRSN